MLLDTAKWLFRPCFLQPWGKKKKHLFAGPWVGEFGWEVMHWQSFLRWLAPQYEKVTVCIRKSSEDLYQDFAHDFVFHSVQGIADCNRLLKIDNPDELERVKKQIPQGVDYLMPLGWQPNKRKKYIKYGSYHSNLDSDIVIHARDRNHGMDRNWSKKKWEHLLEEFDKKNLKVICIGLKKDTISLDSKINDKRDTPLKETLDIIASTKVVVGPSSGPLHLASLCGKQHIVWTDQKKHARGERNRDKYENTWNPFNTPVHVIDDFDFNPEVGVVFDQVSRLVDL